MISLVMNNDEVPSSYTLYRKHFWPNFHYIIPDEPELYIRKGVVIGKLFRPHRSCVTAFRTWRIKLNVEQSLLFFCDCNKYLTDYKDSRVVVESIIFWPVFLLPFGWPVRNQDEQIVRTCRCVHFSRTHINWTAQSIDMNDSSKRGNQGFGKIQCH